MAEFRFDQVTPGGGTPDQSRHDLVPGEVITCVVTDPLPGAGISYTWEIIDAVGSTATLDSTTASTVNIGPFGDINEPCAFRVRLTVNDNGTITVVDRICSVRTSVTGLRVPIFGETAPRDATLSLNDPDDSIDNAIYADRAGRGVSEQNWRGWAEWAWELVTTVESTSGGGPPSGAASGDLGGTYPSPTVTGLQGNTLNAASPSDNDVLTWDNGAGEWVALPGASTNVIQDIYDNGSFAVAMTAAKPFALTTSGVGQDGITITDGVDTLSLRGDKILAPDGSGAAPAYAFLTDPATGVLLNSTPGRLGFATDGAVRATLEGYLSAATGNEVGFDIDIEVDKLTSGVATLLRVNMVETDVPAVTHYLLELARGDVQQMQVTDNGAVLAGDGTDLLPSFSFVTNPATGFREASNTLYLSIAGVREWRWTTTAFFHDDDGQATVGTPTQRFTQGFMGPGTAGAPALSIGFTAGGADADNGLYAPASDQLAVSTGGVQIQRWEEAVAPTGGAHAFTTMTFDGTALTVSGDSWRGLSLIGSEENSSGGDGWSLLYGNIIGADAAGTRRFIDMQYDGVDFFDVDRFGAVHTLTTYTAHQTTLATGVAYEIGSSAHGMGLSSTAAPTLALTVESVDALKLKGLLDAVSGDEVVLDITATVNKAAGNYTGIKVDVTETAAPGTDDRLLDLRTGGSTKAYINNAGQVRASGSEGSPHLSFVIDPTAGFYLAGSIRVAIGGTGYYQFATTTFAPIATNARDIGTTGLTFRRLYLGAGTLGLPAISIGDPDGDTGIYAPAAGQLALVFDGSQRITMTVSTFTSALNIVPDVSTRTIGATAAGSRWGAFFSAAGTAAIPAINISTAGNGFWAPAADQIGVALAGSNFFNFSSTGLVPTSNNTRALGTSGLAWANIYAATSMQTALIRSISGALGMSDDNSSRITGTVQITTSTPANIWTLATTSERLYRLTAQIVMKQDTTVNVYATTLVATFKNDGGTLTQVGSDAEIQVDDGSSGAYSVETNISGTTIQIRVVQTGTDTVNCDIRGELVWAD